MEKFLRVADRHDRKRDDITIEITKCDIDPTAGTKGGRSKAIKAFTER